MAPALADLAGALQEEGVADDQLRAVIGDQPVAVGGNEVHRRLDRARPLHTQAGVEAAQLAEALAGAQHRLHRIHRGRHAALRRGRRGGGRIGRTRATGQQQGQHGKGR
ncbi:hypothetical protein V8017_23025 [Stenotrophomonas rhizophila]